MQQLGTTLLSQAQAVSFIEAIAVLLAIAYVALAIRQNILCWLCAAVSSAIFVWLFFGVHLYMEALLNVFYFAMAIYGWRSWQLGAAGGNGMPVVIWPYAIHAGAIAVILLLSLSSGFLLDTRTDAAFPYIDSMTSWAAVWATFLVARKVLENWWYWLLIDASMIFVFWAKGLEFTALLYVMYLLLIPLGLISWMRSMPEARA